MPAAAWRLRARRRITVNSETLPWRSPVRPAVVNFLAVATHQHARMRKLFDRSRGAAWPTRILRI